MNQTVFRYEEKYLLLQYLSWKVGAAGKGDNKKSQGREMMWNLNHCSDPLQMPVSQLAEDNVLVSKHAATATYCMERSQATSAHRVSRSWIYIYLYIYLLRELWKQYSVCLSAACIGATSQS